MRGLDTEEGDRQSRGGREVEEEKVPPSLPAMDYGEENISFGSDALAC